MVAPKGRPTHHKWRSNVWQRFRVLFIILLVGGAIWIVATGLIPISAWAIPRIDRLFGDSQNIIVALHVPVSGPQEEAGQAILNGAQLAISEAEPQFQAFGYALTAAVYDNASNPELATRNARRIMFGPNVLVVVGHIDTREAIPAAELYARGNLAVVSPAITNPLLLERHPQYVNLLLSTERLQGSVAAEFIAREVNSVINSSAGEMPTVLLVRDGTAYSGRIAEEFEQSMEDLGIPLGRATIDVGSQDTIEEVVEAIAEADREIAYIFLVSNVESVRLFGQAAQDAELVLPIMAPDSIATPDLLSGNGDAGIGMLYVVPMGPAQWYDRGEAFAAEYQAEYDEDPPLFAIEGYDATKASLTAILEAIQRNSGEKPSRIQVRDALRSLSPQPGYTGDLAFTDDGERTTASFFIVQVVADTPDAWDMNVPLHHVSVIP